MAVYSVTMQNQTIVADATLVIIHTDSTLATRGSTIRIHRAWVGNQETETSNQLGIMVALKASAFGTYTSTTPTPHFVNGPASTIVGGTSGAEGTAGTDASAEGAGTVTPIIYDGFNNLNGWLWVPTPEERLVVPTDTAVILKIVGTPATLTGWSAGLTFEELN
jgi:hypothetical protein